MNKIHFTVYKKARLVYKNYGFFLKIRIFGLNKIIDF